MELANQQLGSPRQYKLVDAKLELLAQVPLFAGCGRRQLTELGRVTELSMARPRDVLQFQGAHVTWWTIVAQGWAATCDLGRPTGIVGVGDWWGEKSVLRAEPASVSVVALSPMVLFTVGKGAFRTLCTQFPPVTDRLIEGRVAGRAPCEERIQRQPALAF